ncbi:cation transporter [Streptomyces sp. NPDC019396]|uniref:cation transporter n=1 Tax=Streptomyces sp. NPDC019396 TaxID=3154687 RepID=UPI0033EEE505
MTGTGEAERSLPGIVIAALSLAIMPFLSAAQRKAGRELGSASAVADSKQTLLCTYLSAVLLVGLVLNATLGWSWADPIAALVIAAIAVKEGRDARILAAYGGIFVAGSIAWGMVADGYRPDRYDVIGALVCLAGMAVIMYAPRGN